MRATRSSSHNHHLDAAETGKGGNFAFMPSRWKCLSPTWIRLLRIAGITLLWLIGVFLTLYFVHRCILPIFAWIFPQLENFFYDLAVFGAYRARKYVSFDLQSPQGIFAQRSERCYDGDVFFGLYGDSVTNQGPMILSPEGELVWMSDQFDIATNVNIQRYNGEDYLTFWSGQKSGKLGQGALYMLDKHYKAAYKVHAVGDGLKADLHEFQLTRDGTALFGIYNKTNMDLRPMGWGRPKEGWVEDCIFQEVDIATGELLFQWRVKDHFKPEDTYYWHPLAGYTKAIPMDFYHTNSIEKDSKGNFLISSRHFHHVAYINGTSGDVIWILGGDPNMNQFQDLSDGVATGFKWQHHARWYDEDESILSIMDNGNAGPLHMDAPYSKGLLIQLDLDKFTAKVLQTYVSLGHTRAASQGSLQRLPNGNMFVGWGSSAAYSEYSPDGKLLCETHLAAEWTFWWERVKHYRTFKHRGWIGEPTWPPSAKIKDEKVYVSWNGATEVGFWELQRLIRRGGLGEEWEKVEVIEKKHFEDSFDLPEDEDDASAFFRVAALDTKQNVLDTSPPVQREGSGMSTWGVLLGIVSGVLVVVAIVYLVKVRWRRKGGRLFAWEPGLGGLLGGRGEYQYSRL